MIVVRAIGYGGPEGHLRNLLGRTGLINNSVQRTKDDKHQLDKSFLFVINTFPAAMNSAIKISLRRF